jgi:hypothetical protein
MALNETKEKNLEDKDFDELFTDKKAKWAQLAANAYEYAKHNTTGGKEPRLDDVSIVLFHNVLSEPKGPTLTPCAVSILMGPKIRVRFDHRIQNRRGGESQYVRKKSANNSPEKKPLLRNMLIRS